MSYKVFLVEDEIVTRDGIRDNVNWNAYGFEFCGEAPDGEMALPLLQTIKPNVLITDIRMPFMDGLELSQIVRDRMPTTKIIILSGHDEFEYAQRAIKLGIFEYLLKPVSVQDLHDVLEKVAVELDEERDEQAVLQRLRAQVEENRAALKERFLLRLVTGGATSAEAIERSALLGIDLVSRCYLVVAIRAEPSDSSEEFDSRSYQQIQQLVAGAMNDNPDVFLLRKDMDELVLVMKGNSPENLFEERDLVLERARQAVKQTRCELIVGSGSPQKRIADICRSFMEATDSMQAMADWRKGVLRVDKADLCKVDTSAVEDYLRLGSAEGFDALFENLVRPLGDRALRSAAVKHFIFTDIVLTTAKIVEELGGDVDAVIGEPDNLETILAGIKTVTQLRDHVRAVLVDALAFRDARALHQYAGVIDQARAYINGNYMNPHILLNDVAGQVNFSACHFSAVFSQETGQTFKEYLTEIRITKAKELLRTTAMKVFEICYQVGYKDPHYFSHVFRKATGLTPTEFKMHG